MSKKQKLNKTGNNLSSHDPLVEKYRKKLTVKSKSGLAIASIVGVMAIGGSVGAATYFGLNRGTGGGGQIIEGYKHIAVNSDDARTTFFLNEKLTESDIKSGLSVTLFTGTDKNPKILQADEYSVNIIDTSSLGDKTINVTYNADKNVKTTYKAHVISSEEVTTNQWLTSFYRLANDENIKVNANIYTGGALQYEYQFKVRDDYSTTSNTLYQGEEVQVSSMFYKDVERGKTVQLFDQHTSDKLFVSHDVESSSLGLISSITFDDIMEYTGLIGHGLKDDYEFVQVSNGNSYYKRRFIVYDGDPVLGVIKKTYELNLYFSEGKLLKAEYYLINSSEEKIKDSELSFNFCNSKEEVIPESEISTNIVEDDMFSSEVGTAGEVSVEYGNLSKGYEFYEPNTVYESDNKKYIDSTATDDNLKPTITVNKYDGTESKFKDKIHFISDKPELISVDEHTGDLKIKNIPNDFFGVVNIYYTVASYTGIVSIPVLGDSYVKDNGKIYRPSFLSLKDNVQEKYTYHVGDTYDFETIYNDNEPKLNLLYWDGVEGSTPDIKTVDVDISLYDNYTTLSGNLPIYDDVVSSSEPSQTEVIKINDGEIFEVPTNGYTFNKHKRYGSIGGNGFFNLNLNLNCSYYSYNTSPFIASITPAYANELFSAPSSSYKYVYVVNDIDSKPNVRYTDKNYEYKIVENDVIDLNDLSYYDGGQYLSASFLNIIGAHEESFASNLLDCKLTVVDDGSAGYSHTYFNCDLTEKEKDITQSEYGYYTFDLYFDPLFVTNKETCKIHFAFNNEDVSQYDFDLTIMVS